MQIIGFGLCSFLLRHSWSGFALALFGFVIFTQVLKGYVGYVF